MKYYWAAMVSQGSIGNTPLFLKSYFFFVKSKKNGYQSYLDFAKIFVLTEVFKYESYEGRRKKSWPNHERGVLGKILFAIFKRIHLLTLHI